MPSEYIYLLSISVADKLEKPTKEVFSISVFSEKPISVQGILDNFLKMKNIKDETSYYGIDSIKIFHQEL